MSSPDVDNTPDELFIKVNIKGARELFSRLTAAEVKALMLLALRIDGDGMCFPGNTRAARDGGRKSRLWSGQLHERLERKGALRREMQANHSNTYHLTGVFQFGGSKTLNSVRESDQGGDHITALKSAVTLITPDQKNDHEQESLNKNHDSSKASKNQTDNALRAPRSEAMLREAKNWQEAEQQLVQLGVSSRIAQNLAFTHRLSTLNSAIQDCVRIQNSSNDTIKSAGAWLVSTIKHRAGEFANNSNSAADSTNSSSTTSETTPTLDKAQYRLYGALISKSVRPVEAALIVLQFDQKLIMEIVAESYDVKPTKPGAWIRSRIEQKAGKLIAYPNQAFDPPDISEMPDPYLQDPYFEQGSEGQ